MIALASVMLVLVAGCAGTMRGPAQSTPIVAPATAMKGGTANSSVASGVLAEGNLFVTGTMQGVRFNLGGEEDPEKAKAIIIVEMENQVGLLKHLVEQAEKEVSLIAEGQELIAHLPPFDLSLWPTMKVAYPRFLLSLGTEKFNALISFYATLASLNLRLNERYILFTSPALGGRHKLIKRADELFVLQAKQLLEQKYEEIITKDF